MRFALGFIRRLLLLLLLAASVAGFGAYQYFNQWLKDPLPLPDEGLEYQLAAGRTLSHMVRDLAARDILAHPRAFLLYARVTGQAQVRAGEYSFAADTSPRELLSVVNRGDVKTYRVTLVEGRTFADFVDTLAAAPRLRSELSGQPLSAQLAILDLPIDHPEGWFFPDTYQYVGGETDVAILRRAYRRMAETLEELWPGRMQGLPYETPYQALVMASIIERETGAPWERRKIAGVFVRRLQQGMRLQTDPTVIYGMGAAYRGRISYRDLREPTPYNTYVIHGLPPTPIAMPGREAIYAALHPAAGKALYFVAKGDGTHVFSDTLAAHNAAVKAYQHQRASDYRSTLEALPDMPEEEQGGEE